MKIQLLGYGVDYCMLARQGHLELLVAHIEALNRRHFGHWQNTIQITKDIVVDTSNKNVLFQGRRVHFTGREYGVVEILALKIGSCVTKEEIFNYLYQCNDSIELKIVDVFICKIRKKFKELLPNTEVIETVWGRGYFIHRFSDAKRLINPELVGLPKHRKDRNFMPKAVFSQNSNSERFGTIVNVAE